MKEVPIGFENAGKTSINTDKDRAMRSIGQRQANLCSKQEDGQIHATIWRKKLPLALSLPSSQIRVLAYGHTGLTGHIGWGISALFHGMVLTVGIAFNLQITATLSIPQQAPFHWDVSLKTAPPIEPVVAEGVHRQEAPPSQEIFAEAAVRPPAESAAESMIPQYEELELEGDLLLAQGQQLKPPVETRSQRSDDATSATTAASTVASATPPPDITSDTEADAVQVEAEPVRTPVLHRPPATVKRLVNRSIRPDYGWLMNTLRTRLEDVKTYPAPAKVNHWQGRVVVQVSIEPNGRITNAAIEQSSGHTVLDLAALEALQAASPLSLAYELEGTSVVMLVPINYQLE